MLAAVAGAVLPPGETLPGAEGDGGVPVAEPISRLLAAVAPRTRRLVRAALVVCRLSSFPRRFARLPAERRAAGLARLANGGPLRRDVALLVKTLTCIAYGRDARVRETLGYSATCARPDGAPPVEPPVPPLRPEALVAPDEEESCDVVIVGSGAGGAAVARVLAERGLDVVVLEEGAYHDARDYDADPLAALPMLYRDGGLTFAEGRPTIPLPVGRCVGGTTVINSGTCFRTPDDVLASWRDDFQIGWATDLEGDFEALERDLNVRPVDPTTAGRNAEVCRTGAEAIGASHGPIARNAGDVQCCGACPTGCPLDAKQAAHVGELPRALAAGARVRAGARVVEVLPRNGRAAGVRCRVAGREGSHRVHARAVVLAAGALGTPRLLLRGGLARRSGPAGRHLRIHPACWVGARFAEPVRGWEGVMQSWYVDEWRDRGLFLEATFTPLPFAAHWLPGLGAELTRELERFAHLAVIGVHLSERSEGRVRASGRVTYSLSAEDAARLGFGIARAADLLFAAGAVEVYPQVHGLARLGRGEQARLEDRPPRPADLRLEAFHPLGTARMGADPGAAVVGPSGESHHVPGLWVADGALMPTSLKVNPMITIMACARHVARELAERLV